MILQFPAPVDTPVPFYTRYLEERIAYLELQNENLRAANHHLAASHRKWWQVWR